MLPSGGIEITERERPDEKRLTLELSDFGWPDLNEKNNIVKFIKEEIAKEFNCKFVEITLEYIKSEFDEVVDKIIANNSKPKTNK